MGLIKFELPSDLTPELRSALGQSWLSGGYDNTPVPVRRKFEGNSFSISREEGDSCYLQLLWPVQGSEPVVITTSTLRQRPEPYSLLVELVRGSVNRIRNLVADLKSLEIYLPETFHQQLHQITQSFGRITLATLESGTFEEARKVIDTCNMLSNQGISAFANHRLELRHQAHSTLPTWLGTRVHRPFSPEESEAYSECFNAIRIVPDWSQIEPIETAFNWSYLDPLVRWASESGLGVSIGPLIDLSQPCFPRWLKQWEGDIPSLAAFMCDFIGTVVARYKQQVRVWQLFSGFNNSDCLGLNEDDRIRLAARLLEGAKEIDPEAIWIIGVSQPWGDYLQSDAQTYSPLVFAETLLRAGFRISALDLELLFHAETSGSQRRNLLDMTQLIDLFDHLGVPLEVSIAETLSPGSELPLLVPTAVSPPSVQAVYWDSWSENDSKLRVPGSALWDGNRLAARVAAFKAFRKKWLA